MEYKAFIDEQGIIEVEIVGLASLEEQEQFFKEVIDLVGILKSENKPVLTLVDLNNMQFPGSEVRKRSSEMVNTQSFDKIAAYASNRLIRFTTNMISMAAGRSDKFKTFATKEDAIAWLKQA